MARFGLVHSGTLAIVCHCAARPRWRTVCVCVCSRMRHGATPTILPQELSREKRAWRTQITKPLPFVYVVFCIIHCMRLQSGRFGRGGALAAGVPTVAVALAPSMAMSSVRRSFDQLNFAV